MASRGYLATAILGNKKKPPPKPTKAEQKRIAERNVAQAAAQKRREAERRALKARARLAGVPARKLRAAEKAEKARRDEWTAHVTAQERSRRAAEAAAAAAAAAAVQLTKDQDLLQRHQSAADRKREAKAVAKQELRDAVRQAQAARATAQAAVREDKTKKRAANKLQRATAKAAAKGTGEQSDSGPPLTDRQIDEALAEAARRAGLP